ncbi:putative disease resistance protein RGA3 [Miscanthus floridulus]|uniref:putative disease resistance protein RGA3 n=1 Tax=Miscanthus floridulus TaxID=154761 RepID=UPI0034595003
MAVVLGAFAAKLAGILMGIAKEEVEMLLGVPGEITKLEMTLGDLSTIMADAEVARIRSNTVERWVRELKDAMYDVDDILDLCQIMEKGTGGEEDRDPTTIPSRTASSRCFSITPPTTMFFCFRNPIAAHEIGRKIKALNKRLRDIAERSSRFGFIVRELHSSILHSTNGAAAGSLLGSSDSIVRSGVVGDKIQRDAQDLITLLLQDEVDADAHRTSSSNVIVSAAITGAGGIGKTTLARMVFNDDKVEQSFDERIWLSINKEVDQLSVLRSVIAALCGGGAVGDSRALLECALKQAMRQKKLLVVMDDVWSEDVWSGLLSAPLADAAAPGSRVLVTTRNDEVARKMKARYVHRVGKLEGDDAWVLLKKQVVSDEIDEVEVDGLLKDIGMKIVEKCEGLPLAIKVLGGHLFHISKTRDAWARVCDHFAWSISGIDDDINKAVYLSYEELPSDLKQCFEYCSLFPNNEPIRCEGIVNLWISEGYVNNKTTALSELFEDVGLKHYRELVSRNLLEPKKGSYGHSACTMHDVIRSFAQYITKHEGVLVGEGQDANIALAAAPKIRRLCISNKVVEPSILRKQVSLRTLMLFGSTVVNSKELWSNLSSCLRVLYLDNVNLDELPDTICHLKHLRCLSLCATSISTIPEVIGDLQFLQGIELVKCSNISQLPNSILKLRKLRLLNIRETKITSVPRGFGKLRDLVVMGGFPTHSEDGAEGWCSLEELGSLTKLRVLDVIGLEKAPPGSVAARAKLCNKEHLKELNMKFTSQLGDNGELRSNISKEEQDQAEQVLGNLCPPTCIEELVIKGYYGLGLPQWARMMTALFRGLRRLVLEGYACCEQLPNGLGQLPFLDYLWIDQAPAIQCIGHGFLLTPSSDGQDNATLGTATDLIMSRQSPASLISRGAGFAFPKLTTLGFEGMSGWTEWDWEQQIPAMPALEGLTIDGCKLHRLPPGLSRHATQLTLLDLRNVLNLVTVESFPSLTELKLWDNPRLESVISCPRLHKITICSCPMLKLLENVPALGTAMWMDLGAETLPTYLQEAELSKLNVYCRPSLFKLISLQYDTPEWGKVQHVQRMKAYATEAPGDELKGYMYYTKEPYSFSARLL